MVNLQEAFKKLNMMESSDFELLNQDEKEDMANFLDQDESEAEDVEIIDPQAEDESELEDSYVGKIIVQCPVCKSLIYKTQEELDEEGDEEQTCPYCFSVEKFDLIGKVVPIEDEEAPIEDVEVDDEDAEDAEGEEPLEECGDNVLISRRDKLGEKLRRNRSRRNRKLNEDLENVTLETENEIINISTEDKEDNFGGDEEDMGFDTDDSFGEEPEEGEEEHSESEVIAPLDDEIEDSSDGEVDEVDEESFDEMAESMLRENYSNIVSYRTRKMKDRGNYIVTEGIVTLKNGDKRLTEFRIRPSRFSRDGKGACLVENLQLGKKKVVAARVQMTESKKKINEGIFKKKATPEEVVAKYKNKFAKDPKEALYAVKVNNKTYYLKKEACAEDDFGSEMYDAYKKKADVKVIRLKDNKVVTEF